MSIAAPSNPPAAMPTAVAAVPGSIRVRPRALDRAVWEASAAAVGVPRYTVNVEVSEWGDGLSVRVATKLPIPRLDDASAAAEQTPVIERLRRIQRQLAGDIEQLTGRQVRRVSFAVTGSFIPQRRRVL